LVQQIAPAPRWRVSLRIFVIAAAGAQSAFWLYTFRFIFVNANPTGDAFEFVAVAPFPVIFIFLALVAPSLLLASAERLPSLGAAHAVAALPANGPLFIEIASEFKGAGARP
jgi:hypothetical protein